METIKKYAPVLERISTVTPLLTTDSQTELKTKLTDFDSTVKECQYVKVPLVGIFSAGKSSLLNIFTQKRGMLPIDILPETAIAYELYYDTNERVELFRNGSLLEKTSLRDIKNLNTKPGDIAKVYCNSQPICDLQNRGIILVDMPGIGSGIERHDAAIANYISTGTSFILIVDAEQGSLRGSTLGFMQELARYNQFPSVLISKIDKKPAEDVKDIVDYVTYQMKQLGNVNPVVSTVCAVNEDLGGFVECLNKLRPEELLGKRLNTELSAIIKSVVSQLKVRIDIRTKDVVNVEEKLKQIEEEIEKVKVDLPEADNAETPEKSTQDILNNVRKVLEAKAVDVAEMIVNRADQEEIKSMLISIIRAEIVASLKEESEQYTEATGAAVKEALEGIAAIEVDDDFMSDFSDILNVVNNILAFLPIGGIWANVVEVLLPFLPGVLNWLFGKSESELVMEIRGKIVNECVDKILDSLQPTLLKITTDNQEHIRQKIQAEVVSKMEKVKDALRERIEDTKKSKDAINGEIAQLTGAVNDMNALLASL